MTRQKTLKHNVRARMTKTGESYTAARSQLIAKGRGARRHPPGATALPADFVPPASEAALLRATGKGWAEWLGILDAWQATERGHGEVAEWLMAEHKTSGWWAQSITVGYERARGGRRVHQQAGGFAVGATRTVGVSPGAASAAFTDPQLRQLWLGGAGMSERTSRPGKSARFDWLDDGSRVVVSFDARGAAKTQVAVQHEKLADAAAAERMKGFWRERLAALKETLEG